MSCTESLGLENFDVDDDQNIENLNDGIGVESSTSITSCKRTSVEQKEKIFPPPLSSLLKDGKPSFFLEPIRKDGRLELNEVNIDPSQTLLTSRKGGRLRLSLIPDQEEEEERMMMILMKMREKSSWRQSK
ncbi:uncharacterized protein LOC132054535 [Lycium ferocissimum]|uniref:uncharacterized protein LOC132054535 n=1 Tax=Lycium ferocissimum TaxID=112874 RepID=UPI00281582D3|nr:uncharacterized protein LOC132054535 [Lycium ferocissimum]